MATAGESPHHCIFGIMREFGPETMIHHDGIIMMEIIVIMNDDHDHRFHHDESSFLDQIRASTLCENWDQLQIHQKKQKNIPRVDFLSAKKTKSLRSAVFITPKDAESPGSRRIGVFGELVYFLPSETV